MRRFSAQFVFTNTGPPAKRAVINTEDDGTIISIEDQNDMLKESQSVEFYNGIIIPGFVNCHSHLELSHLKDSVHGGTGLGDFIMTVRTMREHDFSFQLSSADKADSALAEEGVVLCADVCNTSLTFNIKKKSRIRYLNLLEAFGIDPLKAEKRLNEIIYLSFEAERSGLEYSIIPHSAYSVSKPLFRLIKERTRDNRVTSVHFMESDAEAQFLIDHSGPIAKSYKASGLLPEKILSPGSHTEAILDEITSSGNLILVHNTFTDRKTVREINQKRGLTFWCLCPGSNMYIEKIMPPVEMLISEGCDIVIGTDSLASNTELSILGELKLIQEHTPTLAFDELIRWATINGAKALGYEDVYGKIEPGKKPGLLLLQNADLINLKLLSVTTVVRLL